MLGGGGGESEGQSSMVHGAKERRGERQERVELPDSLMYSRHVVDM